MGSKNWIRYYPVEPNIRKYGMITKMIFYCVQLGLTANLAKTLSSIQVRQLQDAQAIDHKYNECIWRGSCLNLLTAEFIKIVSLYLFPLNYLSWISAAY